MDLRRIDNRIKPIIYGGGLGPDPLTVSRRTEIWMIEHPDTDVSWNHILVNGKEINECMNAGMNAYL